MSARWYPPTVATDQEKVRCDCNRTVASDMMYHVPGYGSMCDGCREALFRHGALKRGDYLRSVNAPTALIARADARDGREAASRARRQARGHS